MLADELNQSYVAYGRRLWACMPSSTVMAESTAKVYTGAFCGIFYLHTSIEVHLSAAMLCVIWAAAAAAAHCDQKSPLVGWPVEL